jgi:peptidoglycan/LPS O-acetylase OafA/YrhL
MTATGPRPSTIEQTRPPALAEPTAQEAAPAEVTVEYRPYLDGLRTVAVYLVLLFHAGSNWFAGGYVGVDVFFVLSGFLVTQLLLRDLAASGSIGFRRFYSRRFRRLLPAAFVVLVVTALVYSAVASPVEVAGAVGGFKAAFLYVTNLYFIHQSTDYFAADITTNPVLHFWSLAVEEQFYLLWPLLFGGLFVVARRFGERRWPALRVAVALAAAASLLWALSLRTVEPNRAYYGTDARAYQLLAGALIALTPVAIARLGRFQRAARGVGALAMVGLLVVASEWVHLDAIQRGAAVAALTVVVIVALETASDGILQRVLSLEPMVYLGKISYGIYLWHWIVILVLVRFFHPSTTTTVAVTALLATSLASLSFHMLERPIRLSAVLNRHRLPVIAAGLTISVLGAVVVIPAITNPSTASSGVAGGGGATSGLAVVPAGLDWQAIKSSFPKPSDCYAEPATACTLVHGTGPHVFLMGDSNAEMLIPTFEAIARQQGLTFSASVHLACPWQRDLYARPLVAEAQRLAACERAKNDTYDRVIPALNPDVVVVANQGYEQSGYASHYLGPDQRAIDNRSPEFDAWFERATSESVDQLREGGRKVVLLEPAPRAPETLDTLDCLSKATVLAECRYVADVEPTAVESFYRNLDRADDHVWSIDLDHLVCPYLPICDPIVNRQVVTTDGAHLTREFATTLAGPVAAALRSNGILSG